LLRTVGGALGAQVCGAELAASAAGGVNATSGGFRIAFLLSGLVGLIGAGVAARAGALLGDANG
jgi:hypothetical protein